jgi:hypothetical protein
LSIVGFMSNTVTPTKRSPRPRQVTGREDDLLADEARRILRAEMVRRGFSYKQLADGLALLHPEAPRESVQSLTNKVNWGRFSFAFFLRAAQAMGLETLDMKAPGPGPQREA